MDNWDYTDNGLVLELDEGVKVEINQEIEYDPDMFNPRKNDDGIIGCMFTNHLKYIFGGASQDENNWDTDWEIECRNCNGDGEVDEGKECEQCDAAGWETVDPVTYFKNKYGARVVLALTLYDHSGISMTTHELDVKPGYPYNCQWDSGIVGFYFDTPETIKECGLENWSDDQIKESMLKEIELYDSFLCGEIYYFNVEDPDGESIGGGFGYIGDLEYVKNEAEEAGNLGVEEVRQEKTEREHWAARDMITV